MRKLESFLALVFGLAVLAAVVAATPGDPVGTVLFAKGDVTAVDAENKTRALARSAAIRAGDTLRTGAAAAAHVQFVDGAIVALREQSDFRVDSYRYDARNADVASSIATLIKGGFRTITGAIAKLKPQAYKVHTPVAILGVRGTNYEVLLRNGLYIAVWQGTVTIENKSGVTVLGEGTAHKFAYVPDINTAPQLLTQPPAGLNGILSVDPLNPQSILDNTAPLTAPSGTTSPVTVPPLPTTPPVPQPPPVNLPPLPK